MKIKSKSRANKRRKGRVVSEMPKIEFNRKAIKEIKKRKKGVYKRWVKQSN